MSLMANESDICSWCCSKPTNPIALVIFFLFLLLPNGFSGNGIHHSDKTYTFCNEKHTKRCITIWKNANVWLNKQKNVSFHARRSGLIRLFIQSSMGDTECIIILNKYPLPRKKTRDYRRNFSPRQRAQKTTSKTITETKIKSNSHQSTTMASLPSDRISVNEKKEIIHGESIIRDLTDTVYREENSGKRFFFFFHSRGELFFPPTKHDSDVIRL